jgi:hypothetical protein
VRLQACLRLCDGNQSGPSLKDPLQVPYGPITRSRAKKTKEAMQGLEQCKDWCNPLGMKLVRAQQSKWVGKKENQI